MDQVTEQSELVTTLHSQLAAKEQEIKNRDADIQKLMQRIKVLEDTLGPGSGNTMTLRPSGGSNFVSPNRIASAMQDKLLLAFKGRGNMPWSEFVEILCSYLSVDLSEIKDIKYLVTDDKGSVSKSLWEYLLKWFTPLYSNGALVDPTSADAAFFFKDILGVVSPTWFFGFMNPVDTNKILLKEPSGTFLFRFSSIPGCYTLSVSNQGQVGHWRIKSEKGPDWIAFWIDDRKYDSLTHIIETHLLEQLRVNSERSTQLPLRLEMPYERKQQSEGLYSEF